MVQQKQIQLGTMRLQVRCLASLALLCLWCRPAATAPIRPLAWEPPCATGVALKNKRQKTKKKKVFWRHVLYLKVGNCLCNRVQGENHPDPP